MAGAASTLNLPNGVVVDLDYRCPECEGAGKTKTPFIEWDDKTKPAPTTLSARCLHCHGIGFLPSTAGVQLLSFISRHVRL